MRIAIRFLITTILLVLSSGLSVAGQVRIAVASNFAAPITEIAKAFEAATGNKVTASSGSTGKIYAQILQAAPFDVFVSADQARPQLLEDQGLTVLGSRFTYALGRLALYAGGAGVSGPKTLDDKPDGKIAIANPELAPYGRAAMETLMALFPGRDFKARLVQGENISQTLQFVESGNAVLGFVALAQVVARHPGSYWLVPKTMHAPIAQDAVLLRRAANNPAAQEFMTFLKSNEAAAIIGRWGYLAADARGGS
ncbi:MAG: molybdate ABC transporter substrate-binding protein [Nitratireductor sp.]